MPRIIDRTGHAREPEGTYNDREHCAQCKGPIDIDDEFPVCDRNDACRAERARLARIAAPEIKTCPGCGMKLVANYRDKDGWCSRFVECLAHIHGTFERTPTGKVGKCVRCGDYNVFLAERSKSGICRSRASCRIASAAQNKMAIRGKLR